MHIIENKLLCFCCKLKSPSHILFCKYRTSDNLCQIIVKYFYYVKFRADSRIFYWYCISIWSLTQSTSLVRIMLCTIVHTWCRRGCSLASQEKRSLWSPPLPGDHQRSSLLWISNIIMKSYTKVNKHSWTTKCKRDSPMRFSIPSFFINQTHFGRYFLVQVWSIDEKNCRSKISSDCPSMLYLLVTGSFLLKSACVHQNS